MEEFHLAEQAGKERQLVANTPPPTTSAHAWKRDDWARYLARGWQATWLLPGLAPTARDEAEVKRIQAIYALLVDRTPDARAWTAPEEDDAPRASDERDLVMLRRLHRRHGFGRPWKHGCDTPAGYANCHEDMIANAADLVAELRADGFDIEEAELRRLWEVDGWFAGDCPCA